MTSDITQFDQVEHFWCPMLGQTIKFGYCRKMREGMPCHRLLVCYESHFDVIGFVGANYTPEEQEQFLSKPTSRVENMLDTVEKVRKSGADQ